MKRKKEFVLGIVGSRKRDSDTDFSRVLVQVMKLKPDLIVSGGCKKGADKFAEDIAEVLGMPILIYHPREKVKESYFERNKKIAKKCDTLLALVSKDRKGGTENTIKHAKRLGKEIIIR